MAQATPPHDAFALRIVSVDWYMSRPAPGLDVAFSSFTGTEVDQVPVVRIFGTTPAGAKCCLHLHKAFPYFFIPYPDDLSMERDQVDMYLQRLAASIDRALDLQAGRNNGYQQYHQHQQQQQQPRGPRQHVFNILMVRGRPFYGFHAGERIFLKVFMYRPDEVARAVQLLRSGAVMGRVFQPYEAHIPFLLQLFVDYNLAGMGFLYVARPRFRAPLPPRPAHLDSATTAGADALRGWWHEGRAGLVYSRGQARSSWCELEVDALTEDVLNPAHAPPATSGPAATTAAAQDAQPQVRSLAALWEEERARRGTQHVGPEPSPPRPTQVASPLRLFDIPHLRERLRRLVEADRRDPLAQRPPPPALAPPPSTPLSNEPLLELPGSGAGPGPEPSPRSPQPVPEVDEKLVLSQPSDQETLGILAWMQAEDEDRELLEEHEKRFSQLHATPHAPGASPDLEAAAAVAEVADIVEASQMLSAAHALAFEDDEERGEGEREREEEVGEKAVPLSDGRAGLGLGQLDGSGDEKGAPGRAARRRSAVQVHSKKRYGDIFAPPAPPPARKRSRPPTVQVVRRPTFAPLSLAPVPPRLPGPLLAPQAPPLPPAPVPAPPPLPLPQREVATPPTQAISRSQAERARVAHDSLFALQTQVPVAPAQPQAQARGPQHQPQDQNRAQGQAHSTQEQSHVQAQGNPGDCFSNIPPMQEFLLRFLPPSQRERLDPPLPAPAQAPSDAPEHRAVEGDWTMELKRGPDLAPAEAPVHHQEGPHNQEAVAAAAREEQQQQQQPKSSSTSGSKPAATSPLKRVRFQTSPSPPSPRGPTCNLFQWSPLEPAPPVAVNASLPAVDTPSSPRKRAEEKEDKAGKAPVNMGEEEEEEKDGKAEQRSRRRSCSSEHRGEYAVSPLLHLGQAHKLATTLHDAAQGEAEAEAGCGSVLRWRAGAPSWAEVRAGLARYGLAEVVYTEPFYSNPRDLPSRPRLVAGRQIRLSTPDPRLLPPWPPRYRPDFCPRLCSIPSPAHPPPRPVRLRLTPTRLPPSRANIQRWLQSNPPAPKPPSSFSAAAHSGDASDEESAGQEEQNDDDDEEQLGSRDDGEAALRKYLREHVALERLRLPPAVPAAFSQLEAVTPPPAGERSEEAARPAGPPLHACQHLTLLVIEVLAASRGDLEPNPAYDPVLAIAYALRDESAQARLGSRYEDARGLLCLEADAGGPLEVGPCLRLERFADEAALLRGLVALVRRHDPDMLLGWEVQLGSWGYVVERANHLRLEPSLLDELGRVRADHESAAGLQAAPRRGADPWSANHGSGMAVAGRVLLNLWRILRSEVRLLRYTLEAAVVAVLQRRMPAYSPRALQGMWRGGQAWRAAEYLAARCQAQLVLADRLDLVGRTSEMARVFGIDFFSVLSRGSQYRVESMLLRLTKAQNYVLVSPSREQVAQQRAPECIPLVMEPRSALYTSPVLVLDFQSLYPSIIIAYNMCYSTCLGRLGAAAAAAAGTERTKRFGTGVLEVPAGLIGCLGEESLLVAPSEQMFVRPEVRAGVLPRMLREILETRVMVKQSMRQPAARRDPALLRLLNARQYSLKMIANVTYGYAAASFSGRMPCVDLADAIVQTGRQTLENAIRLIEGTREWGARVVYGDTDSVFVLLEGASRERAFQVGHEIAERVTRSNPSPVRLQFEKIYHPCVLVSKKRYAGYKYELPDQREPVFEAKGIETVRRDTCPAVATIVERSLRLLFEHPDLSRLRRYLERQFDKLLTGRVPLRDLVFCKEVRLGTYSDRVPPPPAAVVAMKRMARDPRAEPRYGERVSYVVVAGPPQARLVDLVLDPRRLLHPPPGEEPPLPNALYYITKQILPALDRLLGLVGADPVRWFQEMPRPARLSALRPRALAVVASSSSSSANHRTLDAFCLSTACLACEAPTCPAAGLCEACRSQPQPAALALVYRRRRLERHQVRQLAICLACTGARHPEQVHCSSLDCPVYFQTSSLALSLRSLDSLAAGLEW